jgi:hypothetical protein
MSYRSGMSIGSSGPNIPSPTLTDAGKGRFPIARRLGILERFDGTSWVEIGRYGSVRDADVALDEMIGGGANAGSLRVTEAPLPRSTLVLMGVGAFAVGTAIAFVLYIFFGG